MRPPDPDGAAIVHPLWPLVLILAEIAARVCRHEAEEHEPATVTTHAVDDAA